MYKMDWDRYYQDQINKSNNNRLNKVSDFTVNQTGSFKSLLVLFYGNKILLLENGYILKIVNVQ